MSKLGLNKLADESQIPTLPTSFMPGIGRLKQALKARNHQAKRYTVSNEFVLHFDI